MLNFAFIRNKVDITLIFMLGCLREISISFCNLACCTLKVGLIKDLIKNKNVYFNGSKDNKMLTHNLLCSNARDVDTLNKQI
jgi:hypothetical protein